MRNYRKHSIAGYSLVEMMVVTGISSMLLVVLAMVFRTGIWEVGRSSGRIELVRNGRHALNQIQRYLSSANAPGNLQYSDGSPVTSAVYTPLDTEIYDPNATNNPNPDSRVRYFTPIDYLAGTTPPGARSLQNNPVYYGYEITVVPGLNNVGQDIVLRRLLPQPALASTPLPLDVDTTVQPRFLGRRLGIPDQGAPGGYRDGLIVRKLREGAIQIEVNVSSDLVSDDLNRNQLEQHTPLRLQMRTIYQPSFYNLQSNHRTGEVA